MSDAICCKLVDYLDELTDEELKRFKLHLENYPLDEGYKLIRHAKTEYADRCDLAGLMIAAYEENKALQMSVNIFNRIRRKDLSEKVQREMPKVFLQPAKPLTKEEKRRKEQTIMSNICAKFSGTLKKVEVTLDPKTAFPTLILSEDRKSVHLGNIAQSLPDNPERFNFFPCVLGAEGIDSGTLEWVVEVGKAKGWAIGAARESIQRKWYQHLTVAQGFWVLQLNHGEYMASTSPPTTLSLWKSPRRIKIQLEYDFQNLSFYDADSGESIFTFNYPFTEKMFPFFQVWDKEIPLKICSTDSEGANCQL